MTRPSFDDYVVARSTALLRFAYVLCGDRHLAEDLVQEVLIKAHRRWTSIESESPDAYLRQALVRTHVSWQRRRAASEVVTAAPPERGVGGGFADNYGTRDEVWALLATLPGPARMVLVLRYLEDLDDRRIAQIMGTSEGAVRVQAHRALRRLREVVTAPAALTDILAVRAQAAPRGENLPGAVRSGVARAQRRRRAAVVGGVVATVVAVLAVLVPMVRPVPQTPPVGPTPTSSATLPITPTITSRPMPTVQLAPADLTPPVFPYAFGWVPAGLGPREVGLIGGQPTLNYGGPYAGSPDQERLGVRLHTGPVMWDWEALQTSTVIVHGVEATLRSTTHDDGVLDVGLTWPQDGRTVRVSGENVPVDDVLRFARSMGLGTTTSQVPGVFSSVLLPEGRVITFFSTEGLCALPPEAVPDEYSGDGLCISVTTGEFTQPPTEMLEIGGRAADYYAPGPGGGGGRLVVHLDDGRSLLVAHNKRDEPAYTRADLEAIASGVILRS